MAMPRRYGLVDATVPSADLGSIARYLFPLMLRNVSSSGFVFTDPADPARFSAPGCIIASPSFELDLASVRQNYVFNWVRDAAVAAIEIAEAHEPVWGGGSGPLIDYVSFAGTCQQSAPTLARACFTIEGRPRDWTDQNDGPALQTLAVMRSYHQLDGQAQEAAQSVVQRNIDFLMAQYQSPGYNLWEETYGQSFFTRSVQLRCLSELRTNDLGLAVPDGVDQAVDWLTRALQDHWNGEYYVSILDAQHPRDGYDPNIDIVMASVYGEVSCTDVRLLATAAALRRQWADPGSPSTYPVNAADASSGRGPLLGRYPGDVYDGDDNDSGTAHPWALCTANFAELHYNLAAAVVRDAHVPYSPESAGFFAQVGVSEQTTPGDAARQLVDVGDAMLQAIVYHSDHLELSEQFDATTGFEKSVRNLTWSYAAFLSAVRARTAAASAAFT
jgi:glucoamylase